MKGKRNNTWYALRRRKVVQWGIAYLVAAWGLLQVLEYLEEAFDWPGQLRQLWILLLLIGLPITLVVAWYHGERGEQHVRGTELAIIAVLFLLGGGAIWRYGRTAEESIRAVQSSGVGVESAETTDTRPSVALVPFANLTSDPANDNLAEGIAETLVTTLAQLGELNVIGPTSSSSFRDRNEDARSIGAKLRARALLEGSVQRAGDHIRVSARLVSTTDGTQLWAATYDRPESDIFAVQDEIATEVTRALSIALAGKAGVGAIGTQDVVAYDLYLRGKQLIERRASGNLEDGIAALERSVERDPTFARAWAELSKGHVLISTTATGAGTTGSRNIAQSRALAEQAAQRAVEIAPMLGAAHAALAQYLVSTGQDAAALTEATRAVELSPDDPWCLSVLAVRLRDAGRPRDALAPTKRALQLDPRNWRLRLDAGHTFDAVGDTTNALLQYREAIRLQPDVAATYYIVGQTLSDMIGQTDLALRFLRRARTLDPDDPQTQRALLAGYTRIGHEKFAKQLLENARRGDADLEYRPALAIHQYFDGSQVEGGRDPQKACSTSWSGGTAQARIDVERVRPNWRGRHAFAATPATAGGGATLARSYACSGETEAAIAELDRLLDEGSGLHGWRALAGDPAYVSLRDNPRFKAIVTHLKAVADGELKRFRARPDLDDGDIEALGRRIDLANRGFVVTNPDRPSTELPSDTRPTRVPSARP
jgi:TolB-like protein/tetratricopeptide (TPR) repeat protein